MSTPQNPFAGSAKPCPKAVADEIGRQWVMVPTKRGLVQVAIVPGILSPLPRGKAIPSGLVAFKM